MAGRRNLSRPTKDSSIISADPGPKIGKSISNRAGHAPRIREATVKKILSATLLLCTISTFAAAHHSFAMYDQTKTVTLTGRLTRFVLGANHAQLLFDLLGPDGKPQLDSTGSCAWLAPSTN